MNFAKTENDLHSPCVLMSEEINKNNNVYKLTTCATYILLDNNNFIFRLRILGNPNINSYFRGFNFIYIHQHHFLYLLFFTQDIQHEKITITDDITLKVHACVPK